MLLQIQIKNIVLIEALTIDFESALGVLTGETGAGKSILLDSLSLALGMRADASLVRQGCDKAQVVAEFDVAADHPVYALLDQFDIDHGGGTILLKRMLNADGRSRATICDQSVSVSTLRAVGELLVEMQGQFDQHGLLNPKSHSGSLSAFAGLSDLEDQTAQAWRVWKDSEKQLKAAQAARASAIENEDRLRADLAFLEALEPRQGEEAELVEQRSLLSNMEAIREGVSGALQALEGQEGAETRLSAAHRSLEKIADKAGEAVAPGLEALNQALIQTNEAVSHLSRIVLDQDAGTLESVEDRLFALREAARRFSVSVDDLVKTQTDFQNALADLESDGASLEGLEQACVKSCEAYVAVATTLSDRRVGAGMRLDAAIMSELPPLKLERAVFTTQVEQQEETGWSADGIDSVQFLLAANPGAAPGPLHKVASGGELSRLLLAIKVVMASVSPVPTLVFDEVDAGVGGATAAAVGDRLARLAESLQILVVTHSPQVAAKGSLHYNVAKSERNGAVLTDIRQLKNDERTEEIARMISGATVTPEARAAATQLLNL